MIKRPLGVDVDQAGLTIVQAFEITVYTDRPVDRDGKNAQHLFQLVHQIEGAFRRAIHFIHECENGNAAHAADFEQLDCLLFDAFGSVNHHDRGVCGNQRAVGVFRKVLMPGGIENVDAVSVVFKLQYRA